MRNRIPHLVAALTVALLATACGAGSDDATPDADAAAGDEEDQASSSSTSTTTTMAAVTDDAPESTTTTSTTTTTTTTVPAVAQPSVTLADVPGLVAEWGAGSGEPLDLAQRIIGFPIEIPVPAGALPHRLSLDLRDLGGDAGWSWDWTYEALSAQPIGDIDAELPEGGPGTIETFVTFDPIFVSLGWADTAQVISDPSSGAGGPQSVNFAYVYNSDSYPVGGIDTIPVVARVWAEEDMIFGDDRQPGHQIDITLETAAGNVPVPLLAALLADLPAAPGQTLTDVRFRTHERSADSFDADKGLRYIEIDATFELAAGSATDAQAAFSAGLDGATYRAGEIDFFDPEFIRAAEPTVSGDTWTQKVIVLDRYEGEIRVTNDPSSGATTAELRIRFESNSVVLQQPSE